MIHKPQKFKRKGLQRLYQEKNYFYGVKEHKTPTYLEDHYGITKGVTK